MVLTTPKSLRQLIIAATATATAATTNTTTSSSTTTASNSNATTRTASSNENNHSVAATVAAGTVAAGTAGGGGVDVDDNDCSFSLQNRKQLKIELGETSDMIGLTRELSRLLTQQQKQQQQQQQQHQMSGNNDNNNNTNATTSSIFHCNSTIKSLVIKSEDNNIHDDDDNWIGDTATTATITTTNNMSEPNWYSEDTIHFFRTLAITIPCILNGIEEIKFQELGIIYGPQGPKFPISLITILLNGFLLRQQQQKQQHHHQQQQQQQERCQCQLKRLVLSVRLDGNATMFNEFTQTLEKFVCLQEIEWEEWCFPPPQNNNNNNNNHNHNNNNIIDHHGTTNDNTNTNTTIATTTAAISFDFNPIVTSMTKLPQLQSLGIKAMTAGSRRTNLGILDHDVVMNLVQRAACLKQLQLVHFQLTDRTIQNIAKTLRGLSSSSTSTKTKTINLEVLSLDLSKTGSKAANELFDMIRTNNTLQEFHIWASTHMMWSKDDCLIHLAKALKDNTTIKSVAIVTHSRTLQEAVQNLTVVDDRIASYFVQMLETNCTLESLVLDDYGEAEDHHHCHYHHYLSSSSTTISHTNDNNNNDNDNNYQSGYDDIENDGEEDDDEEEEIYKQFLSGFVNPMTSIMLFYLAWNISGRRQNLLQKYDTFTQNEWIDILVGFPPSDETTKLEILYYLLRLNPSIIVSS